MAEPRRCADCGKIWSGEPSGDTCPACTFRAALELSSRLSPIPADAASEYADSPGDAPQIRRVGDYELQEQIGEGGMGVVWKAKQVSLNRLVAVKMVAGGAL